MAGVALGDIDLHFAWPAWHLWHWAGSGGALGSQLTPLPSLCVAGVALGGIDLHFCVAGVALGDTDVHFAWQAWHLWHWAGSGGALGSQLKPLSPRLFACTWRHRPAFCLSGVALGDTWRILEMDVHFALQAWDLAT